MPTIEKPEEDENELQLTSGMAPAATPAAPNAAPNAATPAAPAQTSGGAPGRFVNFQRYFSANQGAATKTGNALAGGIQKQGEGVQSELGQRTATFGQGVNTGQGAAAPTVAPSLAPTPVVSTGDPLAPPKKGTPGLTASTPSTPTPAASVPQGPITYGGPNALSEAGGWDDLVAKAGRTAGEAAQTGSGTGLQTLLAQNQKGGAGYTAGQNRFDAGLVGAASGDKFAALRDRFSGLPKSLTTADVASRASSDAAKGRVGDYNAEVARVAAERAAKLPTYGEAEEAPRISSERYDELDKQQKADRDTDAWMNKVVENADMDGSVLGMRLDDSPANLFERAKFAEKNGDSSKWKAWTDYLDRVRGPGAGEQFMNAWRDRENRKARRDEWATEGGKRANEDGTTARKQKEIQNDWFTQHILQPVILGLKDEQERRNAGGWAPDTII